MLCLGGQLGLDTYFLLYLDLLGFGKSQKRPIDDTLIRSYVVLQFMGRMVSAKLVTWR